MITAYYFQQASGDLTVSKKPALPNGDIILEEYKWGPITLWFVKDDHFTADEREAACADFEITLVEEV